MFFGRMRHKAADGVQIRILVSDDPAAGWVDLRRHEAMRLQRGGALPEAALRLAAALVPESLSAALAGGDAFLDAARRAASAPERAALVDAGVRLTNALDPSGYRDYMTFEEHFSFGFRWQGRPIPDVMYELPISYFGNPLAFIGPGETVPWPHYTARMDYELELGIVIGKPGSDLTPDEALAHVAGLTILNDFSARDIQAVEMTGGLGPSKGKHFACAAGPYLTTLDSLPANGLRMRARVNDETLCDANSSEMIWSIAEIVAFASQGERLVPGMLLGSGTCNGGSTVELGRELSPGDRIELEITGLGVLANVLGEPQQKRWWPEAKRPAEAG